MKLSDFRDIHTHDLAADNDSIINLPWGMPVPSTGYYSVGIHPWDSESATEADFVALAELAANPRVVAIGEAGMDALKGASLDIQEQVLRRHIEISEKYQKPLIIHSVRTLSDIMRLRKDTKARQQWVIHGFRGNPTTARQLITMGIDVSLGKKYHPAMPDGINPSHIYHESDNQSSS